MGVWSVLEVGVGIIVACCPALRVLLRKAGDRMEMSRSQRGAQVSERSAQSRGPLASRSSRGLLGNQGLREWGEVDQEQDDHGIQMDSRATPDEKEVYRLREMERERAVAHLCERTNGDISLESVAFRHCENRPRLGWD